MESITIQNQTLLPASSRNGESREREREREALLRSNCATSGVRQTPHPLSPTYRTDTYGKTETEI